MAALGLTTEVLTLQTTRFPGVTLVADTERLITEEGKGVAVGGTLGFPLEARPSRGVDVGVGVTGADGVGLGAGVGAGVGEGGVPGAWYDTSLENALSTNDVL